MAAPDACGVAERAALSTVLVAGCRCGLPSSRVHGLPAVRVYHPAGDVVAVPVLWGNAVRGMVFQVSRGVGARGGYNYRTYPKVVPSMEQSGKESRERLRLSPSARVPGAEIAHAYRASTHAEALGSDFYDVFEMGEGRLAVLIGDVSMRGEEGVALAGSLVLTARSAVLRDGHASPSSVMVEVNRRVLQDAPADAFATMVFGTMEQDGLFRYLNAGHTPFLVVSPSRILELSASSTILGLFEDLPAETSEVWLEAQDVLLLMTNGVLDCRGPDGTYGRQRLWECVSSCERVEPGAIVECVLEDVVRYAGGTFADDLALLAVRPLS